MVFKNILILAIIFLSASPLFSFTEEYDEYFPAKFRQKPKYSYFYTYDERHIGEVLRDAILKKYQQTPIKELRYHVLKIAWNLLRTVKTNKKEINYRFYVLNTSEKFAVSIPDGYIFLTQGLYDWLHSDDEIAVILGHCIAHMEHKHDIHVMKQANVYKKFVDRIDLAFKSYDTISENILTEFNSLRKEDSYEYFADKFGLNIAYSSGYDPWVFIDIYSRLNSKNSFDSDLEKAFYEHPSRLKRIDRIRYVLKDFEYLQRKHIRNLKHGKDEQYYINTGIKFARNNLFKQALYNFQAAIDINPNTDVPHSNMGICYAKMNYYAEAIQCYKRAIDIDPFNANTYYNMSISFRKIENYEQTMYCLEKCLALDPFHDAAQKSFYKLKDYLNRMEAEKIKSKILENQYDSSMNVKNEILDELINSHIENMRQTKINSVKSDK